VAAVLSTIGAGALAFVVKKVQEVGEPGFQRSSGRIAWTTKGIQL